MRASLLLWGRRDFFSSTECTSFLIFCVDIRCVCTHANVCVHTHRLLAGSKDPQDAPCARSSFSLFLSKASFLRRVAPLSLFSSSPPHFFSTSRVPRGLFKSKTSLSQPERILVSETLIITTRQRPDSRLSSPFETKARATSGRM